ncbi:hypothetical protein [Streptomyces violascens]|uniref:hypothetical protein n=1 Tax=Streptomyces violascens TaxID=67381 RepID=UPI00167A83D4|nr:hypothetical protein [Streptomyces violascens]
MELDLLRCGAQVPSMREWQALGPDARRDAAERGALIWAALAHALTQLHRETHAACQFLAGVQIGALDPDDPEDAAERPHLVDDRDMAAAARRTDRSTALTWAFGDLADTLTARLDEAWRALDWWQGQLDSLDGLTEE